MTVNHLRPVAERQPQPRIIEKLELLLEKAKSGELQGLFYVVSDNGNIVYSFETNADHCPPLPVVGALEFLKVTVLTMCVGVQR